MPSTPPLAAAIARYHDPLVRYATRIVGDRERARDVVQDTFVRLCEAGDAIDHDRMGPWLYTVCRNCAVDVRRREARLQPLEERHEDGPHRGGELWEMLGALDDVKRRVVLLRYEAGHSYKSISKLTGLSVSNVGFVLHATVRALRKELVAAALLVVIVALIVWPATTTETARETARNLEVPVVALPAPEPEAVNKLTPVPKPPVAAPQASQVAPAAPKRPAKPPANMRLDSMNAWAE